MENVKIVFSPKDEGQRITIYNIGKFFTGLDIIFKKIHTIEINEFKKYHTKEALTEREIYDLWLLIEKLKGSKKEKYYSPEISSINYNSPLEIVIACTLISPQVVNIGILMLGGKRTGRNSFEIKKGFIQIIVDLLNKGRLNR